MNEIKNILVLIVGTLVFGLLNVVFHWWSDWHLALLIGQLHHIDVGHELYNHHDFVILNSLYSGPKYPPVALIQIFLILSAAGYFTTKALTGLVKNEKVSR